MPVNLSKFDLGEMLRLSLEIRRVGRDHPTMETAARSICRYLYDDLVSSDGGRACALVRAYKTHLYGKLPADLRQFAGRALRGTDASGTPAPDMRCLALLASAGDEPDWNLRQKSHDHQAIPLPSAQIVSRAPMIAQLIREFGLSLNDVVRPSADVVRNVSGRTYGVFHVEHAAGSPYIPAQSQFVERYGIRSVVGFGGSLTSGELFAVILFARTHITPDMADRFRTIALDAKGCLLPFTPERVFDSPHSRSGTAEPPTAYA